MQRDLEGKKAAAAATADYKQAFSSMTECHDRIMEQGNYDEETAWAICQTIVGGKAAKTAAVAAAVAAIQNNNRATPYEDKAGRLFLKIFLLDGSVNLNSWGVSPASIQRNIYSAIGKPVVIYKTENGEYDHPPLQGQDSIDHALAFQDLYKIGTYVDVFESKTKPGEWWGTAEITDENVKKAIREDPNIPFYVSPTIRLLQPLQNEHALEDWSFMHSAVVDKPAFGTNKAYISGQCNGNANTCLLQLRKASITANNGEIGCGFCTYKAIKQIQQKIINTTREAYTGPNDVERPDSHFAYVPKDKPPSARKFPIFDAPHTRNALARFSQADLPQNKKGEVLDRICKAAKKFEIESELCEEREGSISSQSPNKQHLLNRNNIMNTDDNKKVVESASSTSPTLATQQESQQQQLQQQQNKKVVDVANNGEEDQEQEKNNIKGAEQQQNQNNKEASGAPQELLETVQRLSTRNKELELQLQTAKADKGTLQSLTEQLNERLAKIEQEREEEHSKARASEIARIVTTSAAYQGLSQQDKEKQIEMFTASSMPVEQIKNIIEPLNASVRKASLGGFASASTNYTSRLNKGVETRSASTNNNNNSSNNSGDELPAHLRLHQYFGKPAGSGIANETTGGIQ